MRESGAFVHCRMDTEAKPEPADGDAKPEVKVDAGAAEAGAVEPGIPSVKAEPDAAAAAGAAGAGAVADASQSQALTQSQLLSQTQGASRGATPSASGLTGEQLKREATPSEAGVTENTGAAGDDAMEDDGTRDDEAIAAALAAEDADSAEVSARPKRRGGRPRQKFGVGDDKGAGPSAPPPPPPPSCDPGEADAINDWIDKRVLIGAISKVGGRLRPEAAGAGVGDGNHTVFWCSELHTWLWLSRKQTVLATYLLQARLRITRAAASPHIPAQGAEGWNLLKVLETVAAEAAERGDAPCAQAAEAVIARLRQVCGA